MKIILIVAALSLSFFSTCQYKMFAVESYTALGKPVKGMYGSFISYGAKLQFNCPRIYSFSVGIGQEHQSISSNEFVDIPTLGSKRSKIHTNEVFMPIAARASFGKKILVFVEPCIQLNFYGKAHWKGVVDYYYNDGIEDKPFDFKENMTSMMTLSIGTGLVFPVYRGLHGYVKYVFSLPPQTDYTSNDDYLSTSEITPYSYNKFSVGLSYFFNLKKDSKYTFTTYYLKFEKSKL